MQTIQTLHKKHVERILNHALCISRLNSVDDATSKQASKLIEAGKISELMKLLQAGSKTSTTNTPGHAQSDSNNEFFSSLKNNDAIGQTLNSCVIDISDVINYLIAGHKTVSGIQRLVIATLASIPSTERVKNVLVSMHDYEKKGTVSVDWKLIDLIGDYISKPDINPDFLTQINIYISNPIDNSAYLRCTTLLIMGAAWIVPSFPKAHREIAKKNKLYVVSVLYDLIPYTYPDFVSADASREFYFYIESLLSISDSLISISKYVSDDLRRNQSSLGKSILCFPVNQYAELARQIPFQSNANKKTESSDEIISQLKSMGVEVDNFILNVGSVEIRKNHIGLFCAWRKLLAKFEKKCPQLVIVGRAGWKAESFFEALKSTNNLDGKILLLHGISDITLANLYSACKFTVYPSLEEGWGLPIGESLDAGKLCITSNRASMPEVGRDLCLYVDPTDPLNIAETIEEVLLSPEMVKQFENSISLSKPLKGWKEYQEELASIINKSKTERLHPVSSLSANNFKLSLGQVVSFYWHLGTASYELPEALSGKKRSINGNLPSRLITSSSIDVYEPDGTWCREPKFSMSFYIDLSSLRVNGSFVPFNVSMHFLLGGDAKTLSETNITAQLTIYKPDLLNDEFLKPNTSGTSQVLSIVDGNLSEISYDLASICFELPNYSQSLGDTTVLIYPIKIELNWSSSFDFVCPLGRNLSCIKIKEFKIGN